MISLILELWFQSFVQTSQSWLWFTAEGVSKSGLKSLIYWSSQHPAKTLLADHFGHAFFAALHTPVATISEVHAHPFVHCNVMVRVWLHYHCKDQWQSSSQMQGTANDL